MFNQFTNQPHGNTMGYNDCAIDGYCSLDPIVYSLMEVLLYELKQITYYYIKMRELGYENKAMKDKIINYLSLILIGYEFKRDEFHDILKEIHENKEQVKSSFISFCDKQNIDCQILKSNIQFEKFDFSSLVNQGEQQAIQRNKALSPNLKNLFEIILNLIKSASIRLIELKYYTDDYLPEEDGILKLFNNLNFTTVTEAKLIKKINDFAEVNFKIHQKLHVAKEEYFGKIALNDVLIGTLPGHSVLVSGQNLKDLEMLLEATKDEEINIYTHNGLIVAHAYPKFEKYENLKGHFQMSLDSFQYDFAAFKGPVLIVRNFQYILDRVYRGRIYTTNLIAGKGMSRINKFDFKPLIESAKGAAGFEKENEIYQVKVGYDEKKVFKKIDKIIDKINKKEIEKLIIVGLLNHAPIKSEYFEKLEEILPEKDFVLSTSFPSNKKNVLSFDSFFNSSLIYKILAYMGEKVDFKEFSTSVFLTTCNIHTISHLFNLRRLGIKNIYLPACTTNVITPNMLQFLKDKFKFKQVGENPADDLGAL